MWDHIWMVGSHGVKSLGGLVVGRIFGASASLVQWSGSQWRRIGGGSEEASIKWFFVGSCGHFGALNNCEEGNKWKQYPTLRSISAKLITSLKNRKKCKRKKRKDGRVAKLVGDHF